MSRCDVKGCRKKARYEFEGKTVCKIHRCRCYHNLEARTMFGGCLVHNKNE